MTEREALESIDSKRSPAEVMAITPAASVDGEATAACPLAPASMLGQHSLAMLTVRWGAPDYATQASAPRSLREHCVNVTSVNVNGDGYLVTHPACTAVLGSSTVNHPPGGSVSNRAFSQINSNSPSVASMGFSAHVVNYVIGWFGADTVGRFTPIEPVRDVDTRRNSVGPLRANESRSFAVRGPSLAPGGASTAVMNLTSTQLTATSPTPPCGAGTYPTDSVRPQLPLGPRTSQARGRALGVDR